MNERIKELLEQAGVKYVTMPKDTVYEKFAELIIHECASIVENQGRYLRYDVLSKKIKDHFEIKK